MPRSSWDTVWADVAQAVARRSACERAQVGAVIVKQQRVVSTGYNGPASRDPADTGQGCKLWCDRARTFHVRNDTPYGYACPSIHAEANALLYASREQTEGSLLYVTHAPCADCAKLISASGVAGVVILREIDPHRPNPVPYLEGCGVKVTVLAPE